MKLIDKDAVVAEIERRTDELWALIPDGEKVFSNKHTKEDTFNLGKYTALESLDKFIDTLEVKELDLEDAKKEELAQKYVDYTFKRHNIDANSKEGLLIYYAFMHGMNKCLTQLKAQKGE